MDADSLNDGFRVGNWLIQPRESRASTDGRMVDLSNDELAVLVALAIRHGEAVHHRALRNEIWAGGVGSEEKLRQAVGALRELFGDKPRHRRYIASVGNDAYALVAHFERVARVAAAPAPPPVDRTPPPVGRWQQLLAELQRRHVFKVMASYMVGMWVMLQVAQVTFEPLRFPAWWMTALTILAVIGLPIVTALAWTYEITPNGVMVDIGADSTGVMRRLARPRQSIAPVIVTGVALMALVTGFAWWCSLDVAENAAAGPGPPLEPGLDRSPFCRSWI